MVRRDRGQLILVGAVAIALVLLGLVLIVNTALFTQVVGSEGTVESAKEGGITAQEVGDAIGAIAAEENLQHDTRLNINNGVYSATQNELQPIFANRTVESSGSFVSMGHLDIEQEGTVIEQDTDAALGDWQPVDDSDVGQFVVVIDTAASPDEEVEFVVDSPSRPERTLEVVVNNAGDRIDLSGAGASCTGIRATGGEVRIDLRHGSVYEDGSCHFDLFTSETAEYDVTFDGGDDVTGTYVLATEDTSIPAPLPGTADESLAAWRISYELTYASPGATVSSSYHEVDVYD